jgi:hypothetical protein
VCTGLSGEQAAPALMVGSAISAQSVGDTWPAPMVTRPHRTVRCATKAGGCNGRLRQIRKEFAYCSCPVRPRTEGKYCLPIGAPTAPSCLGAIKGTPRHMEQYTKHLLNILRHRDLAFAQLIRYVRDLSTFMSCNSIVLLSCARSRLVCVLVLRLSLWCVLLFSPYSHY